jgi:hypothetical protein
VTVDRSAAIPRIVIVLSDAKIRECETNESGAALLTRPEIRLLSPDTINERDTALASELSRDDLLHPGMVLLRSPYNYSYFAEVKAAGTRFALEKCMLFSRLCQLLGADRIAIKEETVRVAKKRRHATAEGASGGKSPAWAGDLNITSELTESIRHELTLEDVFEGGPAEIAGAEEFLREGHLSGEPTMQALLVARRPSTNSIRSRHLRLDLFRESQHLFEAVAQLKLPAFLGIRADVEYAAEEVASSYFSIDLVVQFGCGVTLSRQRPAAAELVASHLSGEEPG